MIFALLVCCVGAAFPATGAPNLQGAGAAGPRIVVMPFENASRTPAAQRLSNWDWLGEGLAELTSERLAMALPSAVLRSRNERIAAMERLGLPAATGETSTAAAARAYSRATMLRIGEELDSAVLVFGSYEVDGARLSITARVLRLDPPHLFPPVQAGGALDTLMELHGRVTRELIRLIVETPLTRASVPSPLSPASIRLDALEQYVRGVQAGEQADRLRYLREAARLDPGWPLPAFALGQEYYARSDCQAALIWFSRVPPAHPAGFEAGFTSGVCHLMRDDALRAEAAFAALLPPETPASGRLIPSSPAPEVLNNLAVAKWLRSGGAPGRSSAVQAAPADPRVLAALLERAIELDPEEPDYRFNLALLALRRGDTPAALRALRQVLAAAPDDADAASLLAALTSPPAPAGTSGGVPQLALESLEGMDRVKTSYDHDRVPGRGPRPENPGGGRP